MDILSVRRPAHTLQINHTLQILAVLPALPFCARVAGFDCKGTLFKVWNRSVCHEAVSAQRVARVIEGRSHQFREDAFPARSEASPEIRRGLVDLHSDTLLVHPG